MWNDNYGGRFFPAARLQKDDTPQTAAAVALHEEVDYWGRIVVAGVQAVEDRHFSPQFHRERDYTFHVCAIALPGVSLCKPPNRLEAALARGGPSWSGVGEDLLRQAIETDSLADHRLSPTLAAVGPAAITLGAGA